MRSFVFIPALLCVSASAAEKFPAANGLERSLVAREPLLQNPVSVSVDVDGTVYVTETLRRKAADLDIREFANYGWIPHDVALTSLEQKRAFLEKELVPGKFDNHPSLKDHNGDGVVDIKDLTALSEKIIRLTDTNGDGVMDTKTLFADGFNTDVTGIAAGVFAWRGDVYATIAPDVWKLRDTTGDGKADKRESLVQGFGVHIAYAGHDMHGPTLGPDGRIYWSIGDKGTNVTSKEGTNYFAPHEGAVLRSYPDGSGFEIFARGLRNPQEIAFDQYGNIFSVDNDSDRQGERERFLHITEGSDAGWRNYYQYRTPEYNPWMAENIWEPTGEFQPAYITPTNINYSDGPAGFAFNPGTALNEKYHNSFFVSEFPKGAIRSFKVEPKGATFEMTDDHVVVEGPMNVGLNFGPDGALYSADWGGGYPLNDKGAIWKLDDPSIVGTDIRTQVAEMLKAGPTDIPAADLVKRLSHPDQRIRLDAQWELAARKAKDELVATASTEGADEMAVIHSLWGLAQMKIFDPGLFGDLAKSANAELRAQAAKYAGETGAEPVMELKAMLADENARVRFSAATAIWKLGMDATLDEVITMIAENADKDPYLRHAGVLAMTVAHGGKIAEKTINHPSPSVRLAAAVALRRLSSPHTERLLADSNPRVIAEAARAIFDDPAIPSAYPALAELIRTTPEASVPAARRSIAANRYLADEKSAARLAQYAANADAATDLRIAALEALASWTDSSNINPVDGRHDPMEAADGKIAKAAYLPFANMLQQSPDNDIAKAAAAVSKSLGIVAKPRDLAKEALDSSPDPGARIRSLDALQTADPKLFSTILPGLLADKSPEMRSHAASLLMETDPAAVIGYAKQAIMKSQDMAERQHAVLLLGKTDDPAAKALLNALAGKATEDPTILLELSEVLPELAKNTPQHSASLEGGDPELGEAVFNEHLAAQCVACHRIGKEGSNVGPPLTAIGSNGREHILDSLVLPQGQITPGYGLMSVTKKDGTSLAGALKNETPSSVTLILPDQTEITVSTADIATRTQPVSSMPAMGAVLSPRELRDLVAYLAGLK